MRQSGMPLTTRDLAQHVMAERGLNTTEMRHQQAMGTMRSEQVPVQHFLWSVSLN